MLYSEITKWPKNLLDILTLNCYMFNARLGCLIQTRNFLKASFYSQKKLSWTTKFYMPQNRFFWVQTWNIQTWKIGSNRYDCIDCDVTLEWLRRKLNMAPRSSFESYVFSVFCNSIPKRGLWYSSRVIRPFGGFNELAARLVDFLNVFD